MPNNPKLPRQFNMPQFLAGLLLMAFAGFFLVFGMDGIMWIVNNIAAAIFGLVGGLGIATAYFVRRNKTTLSKGFSVQKKPQQDQEPDIDIDFSQFREDDNDMSGEGHSADRKLALSYSRQDSSADHDLSEKDRAKVKKLHALADHTATPDHERKAAKGQIKRLRLKYLKS
jgi:hypothetical protein